jgi:hypothetical protein
MDCPCCHRNHLIGTGQQLVDVTTVYLHGIAHSRTVTAEHQCLGLWSWTCIACGHEWNDPATTDAGARDPQQGGPMSPQLQRYWVFAGDTHYPLGGMHDLHGMYATQAGASAAAEAWMEKEDADLSWWQVVDAHTGAIIAASPVQGYHH